MVYYIRVALPKMPRMLVWLAPMVLSSLLSFITNVMQTTKLTPGQAIALGCFALVIREAVNTFSEHKLN